MTQTHTERQSSEKTKRQPNQNSRGPGTREHYTSAHAHLADSIPALMMYTHVFACPPCPPVSCTRVEKHLCTQRHTGARRSKRSYKDSAPPPPTQTGSVCSTLCHACSAQYHEKRTDAHAQASKHSEHPLLGKQTKEAGSASSPFMSFAPLPHTHWGADTVTRARPR